MALCLALVQPLLASGWLPGLHLLLARRIDRAVGIVLVTAVVVHVAGLWITSPPDVIDALLMHSPTPFSVWGVTAMWALFAAALLAALRRRLSPRAWRIGHTSLVSVVVVGGVIHALLIEGTMEAISKVVLCGLVIVATAAAVVRPWLRARGPTSSHDEVWSFTSMAGAFPSERPPPETAWSHFCQRLDNAHRKLDGNRRWRSMWRASGERSSVTRVADRAVSLYSPLLGRVSSQCVTNFPPRQCAHPHDSPRIYRWNLSHIFDGLISTPAELSEEPRP